MYTCDKCGFKAKTPVGLIGHYRLSHPHFHWREETEAFREAFREAFLEAFRDASERERETFREGVIDAFMFAFRDTFSEASMEETEAFREASGEAHDQEKAEQRKTPYWDRRVGELLNDLFS